MTDTRLQLEKLDQQIIQLLEERVQLCIEARERQESMDTDSEAEELSLWMEEAADRGLDEQIVEKIGRLTQRLCRTEEE